MKKISYVLLLALGLGNTAVYAATNQNQAKLETVKHVYQYYLKTDSAKKTLNRFGDASVKKAVKQWDKDDELHPSDAGCMGNPITQTDDMEDALRGKLPKLSLLSSGQVKAVLANRATANFVLNCTGNQCKVSDILSKYGSFKKLVWKECKAK